MGFEPAAKALVLSMLLTSFIVNVFAEQEDIVIEALPPYHHGRYGPAVSPIMAPSPSPSHHHHHKHHPPSHPPAHPPSKPPSHPPVKPPTKPPSPLPTRKLVAVQGVVYCKSCKYNGIPTLLGASPLSGAVVKLECNNTRYPLRIQAKTDKNGYFFIQAPKTITTYGAHKCKVSLISSPLKTCNKPTDFHGGLSGSLLRLEKTSVSKPLPFVVYTVGPLAFEPPKTVKCP